MPNSSKAGLFLLAFFRYSVIIVPCVVIALLVDAGTVGQRALAGILISLLISLVLAYFTTRKATKY